MDNVKKYTRKTASDGATTESYEFHVPPMQKIPKPVDGDVTYGDPTNHPGDPKGVDTIPAWLSEGEFVMNPQSVEMYSKEIEAMNNHGRIIQAAEGGLIPQYHNDGGKAELTSWIDDVVLNSVRMQESGGGRYLESPAGALGDYGLMPVAYMGGNDEGTKGYGHGVPDTMIDPLNPEEARQRSTEILKGIQEYNPGFTPEQVLQAYHSGVEGVKNSISGEKPLGPIGAAYGEQVLDRAAIPENLEARFASASDNALDVPINLGQEIPTDVSPWDIQVLDGEDRTELRKNPFSSEQRSAGIPPDKPKMNSTLGSDKNSALDLDAPTLLDQINIPGDPLPSLVNISEEDRSNAEAAYFKNEKDFGGIFPEEVKANNTPQEKLGFFEKLLGKDAIDKVKDSFANSVDNLFDTNELTSAAVLYLGQRLMGYSHEGSFSWTAKNYATNVLGKIKNADKLFTAGTHTKDSIEEYRKTGDASKLKLVPEKEEEKDIKVKTYFKTTFGGGNRVVEVIETPQGPVQIDRKSGQRIPIDLSEYSEYTPAQHGALAVQSKLTNFIKDEADFNKPDEDGNYRKVKAFSPPALVSAYATRLQKLQGNRADLYMLNSAGSQRLLAYSNAATNYYENNGYKQVKNYEGLMDAVDSGLYTEGIGMKTPDNKPIDLSQVSKSLDNLKKLVAVKNNNGTKTNVASESASALNIYDRAGKGLLEGEELAFVEAFERLEVPEGLSKELFFLQEYFGQQIKQQ